MLATVVAFFIGAQVIALRPVTSALRNVAFGAVVRCALQRRSLKDSMLTGVNLACTNMNDVTNNIGCTLAQIESGGQPP